MLSFIIPVYNEEESIAELFERIEAVCETNHYQDHEILFVDDGSSDGSVGEITTIIHEHPIPM